MPDIASKTTGHLVTFEFQIKKKKGVFFFFIISISYVIWGTYLYEKLTDYLKFKFTWPGIMSFLWHPRGGGGSTSPMLLGMLPRVVTCLRPTSLSPCPLQLFRNISLKAFMYSHFFEHLNLPKQIV